MSGGYFNYSSYNLQNILDEIESIVNSNETFSEKVIDRFIDSMYILKQAVVVINRVDYFLEGDDSEETFLERWDEDMEQIKSSER